MARILVSGHGAAPLIERLRDGLGEDWTVLDGPHVEGFGPVDGIVLHERQGAAVVLAFQPGSSAPADAAAEFRHMLDSHGISRALGGHLPIVGLALDPQRMSDPAGALRRAFLAEPAIGVRTGWTQRIAALFEATPAPPAPAMRRSAAESLELRADREDAWRVLREPKGAPALAGLAMTSGDHVVPAETVREGGAVLWAGMALAVVLLGAVLAGMAMLSYGNGPDSATAVTQAR
jgi:hypothetical protein